MKKLFLAALTLTMFSTAAMANNSAIRADLLRAQALIDSALEKLEQETEITGSRKVQNSQFICRETGTSIDMQNAINSLKKELQAKCGSNCEVVLDFEVVGQHCQINGTAIPRR